MNGNTSKHSYQALGQHYEDIDEALHLDSTSFESSSDLNTFGQVICSQPDNIFDEKPNVQPTRYSKSIALSGMHIPCFVLRSLALLLAVMATIGLLYHLGTSRTGLLQRQRLAAISSNKKVQVILRENAGWHDEVTASFMEALSRLEDIQTHVILKDKRYNASVIFDSFDWLNEPQYFAHDNFIAETISAMAPQVIISVTCALDLAENPQVYDKILLEQDTILFCVVHHPDYFYMETHREYHLIKPWIKARRLRFLALSSHIKDVLDEHLDADRTRQSNLDSDWKTYTFPPVFSVDKVLKGNDVEVSTNRRPYLALQGNFESFRRDYRHAFEDFGREVDKLDVDAEERPQLYVIGQGDAMDIPKELEGTITFRTNLPYPKFYRILHGALALLPAFADDTYFFTKASSTIAASLISGTPVIASSLLLKKYTYLNKDTVFLRQQHESEAQAAMRLVSLAPLLRSRLSASILKTQKSLIDSNSRNLGLWLRSAAKDELLGVNDPASSPDVSVSDSKTHS